MVLQESTQIADPSHLFTHFHEVNMNAASITTTKPTPAQFPADKRLDTYEQHICRSLGLVIELRKLIWPAA
jgi:hypothetical protein